MKMSTLAREMHEEFMRDSTEYCCYCYEVRSGIGCCGENHFAKYSEMDEATQQEVLAAEIYNYEKATK